MLSTDRSWSNWGNWENILFEQIFVHTFNIIFFSFFISSINTFERVGNFFAGSPFVSRKNKSGNYYVVFVLMFSCFYFVNWPPHTHIFLGQIDACFIFVWLSVSEIPRFSLKVYFFFIFLSRFVYIQENIHGSSNFYIIIFRH